jgi:hypothetical protein
MTRIALPVGRQGYGRAPTLAPVRSSLLYFTNWDKITGVYWI